MISFDDINDWKKVIATGCAVCLDYGNKRTGIAISDASWTVATPLKILETSKIYEGLSKILQQYKIGLIVIGIPVALNGGVHGKQHKIVNEFAQQLQKFLSENAFNLPIMQYDERLSTVAASRALSNAEFSIKKKQKRIDKVAATFVLQGVLDRIGYKFYGN